MSEFVGIAVISAVCGYLLDRLGFGGTRLYFSFVSVVMMLACVRAAAPLISGIMDFSPSGLAADVGTAALRVLGIGYVGGFFSDFCAQLGAKGASDGLLLFTRIQILSVVMPYFIDLLGSFGELMQ